MNECVVRALSDGLEGWKETKRGTPPSPDPKPPLSSSTCGTCGRFHSEELNTAHPSNKLLQSLGKMEMDYEQTGGSEKHSSIDDASMHTITASSMQQPLYEQQRPQTSYSDTGFSRPYAHSESGTPEQYQHGNGLSRPPSTQSQNQYGQDAQRQQAQKNSSVVIKVGMVGDAQIGKTSLMVKYVEGSWDEDYIQTLGVSLLTIPRNL